MIQDFPTGKYNIIYADPPWEVKAGPDWNSNGKSRPLLYPTMSIDEIESLQVKNLSNKDCCLYIWVINKYIEQSYQISKSWGFNPVCLLTWCKQPHGLGLGGSFVQTTEHLLFCRKGHLKTQKRVDTTWFEYKRGAHSVKPAFFRDMIVEVHGDLPRIELFARQSASGWDCWGNEIPNVFTNTPVQNIA